MDDYFLKPAAASPTLTRLTHLNHLPETKPMKTIKLKRFTDPEVSRLIVVKHLAQFFDQFTFLLLGRNLPLPAEHHAARHRGLLRVLDQLSRSPETLPDPLIEALLAIEELARA